MIIQNDYEEKDWPAYKIWKNHPSKKWDYSPVKRLLKKFRQVGSINKRHGSGRPRNVFLEENMDLIGELVCSQKERPHTYLAPRKIDEQIGISQSSIQRMMKKINVKRFKRLKTPQMNEGI